MAKIKDKNRNLTTKVFLLMAVLTLPSFLFIDQADAVDCNLSINKTTCKKLEEQKKRAEQIQSLIDINRQKAITVKNQLAVIDTQQQTNQVELGKTQNKVEDLDRQVNNLDQKIKDKEKLIASQQIILAGLMRTYYDYSQGGILDVVLINQDFSEIFNQTDHIKQAGSRVSDVLKAIQEAKSELQNEQTNIAQKKQESEQAKKDLENKNLTLQKSENQKQALLGQTQAEAAKYKELLSNIEDEISNLEQSLSSSLNMANLPPDKSGYFTWPVNPHIFTQGYGKTSFAKTSGIYKNNFHNGVDFGIKYSNVFAAKNGKVVGSGDNGKYAYGKWLAIDHGDGLVTLYGHLSAKAVAKGSSVKEGQKIGTSGNTGNSTGPHLHFSVFAAETFKTVESSYVNGLMIPTGASVNPKKYL